MSVTSKMILYTRRVKKNGKFPVKLQVISNRESKHYQTIFELSQENFDKLKAPRLSAGLAEVKTLLDELLQQVKLEISKMADFSFYLFEVSFISQNKYFKKIKITTPQVTTANFFDFAPYVRKFPILENASDQPLAISRNYCDYIKSLLLERRIGNAISYRDSYNSLCKHFGDRLLTEITSQKLKGYEQWMLDKGRKLATVGVKLRSLRTIFNIAIDAGLLKKDHYPFGKRKYRIPGGKKNKKAIFENDLKKLFDYIPDTKNREKAKDFWFFLYYANGMNVADAANLKWGDIEGDYFSFIRKKTEYTTKEDQVPVTVYINDHIRTVINKWGSANTSPNGNVFPIINPDSNPLEQYEHVTAFSDFLTSNMTKIGAELGISIRVTTKLVRPTFSTQLKTSGVSTEYIKDALGHANVDTTDHYLANFPNEVIKTNSQLLDKFKKASTASQFDTSIPNQFSTLVKKLVIQLSEANLVTELSLEIPLKEQLKLAKTVASLTNQWISSVAEQL